MPPGGALVVGLDVQVQSLMSELEEMRDSSAVASSSRLMLSNLQQQCDNAQTELLATAAIVQKLEARVLKAERDAAQAHQVGEVANQRKTANV